MSPAPPCTSTMGSIATFVYRRIRIICKMLFRKFTIQKSFVDIYTHIHLIYSNFIVSNSANQFPVWKPGAATVSMYCTYAKKKNNDLILSECYSDLRSKVKDLTSTSKSYAIKFTFQFTSSFYSNHSLRSQQHQTLKIYQSNEKQKEEPTKRILNRRNWILCFQCAAPHAYIRILPTIMSTISFVILNCDYVWDYQPQ